jgi:IS5 family transposase
MLGKSKNQLQTDIFAPLLVSFIDLNHDLVLLADDISWKLFEKEFAKHYSHTGQTSMPIRLMVGCLMLKNLYNLGDETLVEAWIMNPYMQYFCGESVFVHEFPCDPSDFVHFRKRIGAEGIELIFKYSVECQGAKAKSDFVVSDTTVQENNTTFPTDAKLCKKIIDQCHYIAKKENIIQRQSYKRVSKQLVRDSYNSSHPKRAKKAKASQRKIKTLAGRVVREIERSPVKERYQSKLDIYNKIITQEKTDKNKIYSIHKPDTACIAKGKAHKQYEFGNKVGLAYNPKQKIILAIKGFDGNPHDSKTIEPLIDQMIKLFDYKPKEIAYDRGGKGNATIQEVTITTPTKPKKYQTQYQKNKIRKKFNKRAAIEPIISHLKQYFRMGQNFYSLANNATINAQLAATGWNLKKRIEVLKKKLKNWLDNIFYQILTNREIFSY